MTENIIYLFIMTGRQCIGAWPYGFTVAVVMAPKTNRTQLHTSRAAQPNNFQISCVGLGAFGFHLNQQQECQKRASSG